ncbi:MAG: inositol monophosphatase [Actinobacteria bacterium HGW-Actinobacteria-6]|nr:MAG: inositol monophosphatase [Actinobacteria bacterium HGW-Actinobacteria-6]
MRPEVRGMEVRLETAIAAATAGGDVLASRAGDLGSIRTKSSAFDMVTEADIASGVAVVRFIAERFEGARFVVEEPEVYSLAGVAEGSLDDPEVWVIDPLDGTTSFIHAYPCYSVSVACLQGGQPVVGAVRNVPARETTWASLGGGAFLDGRRLQCTSTATIRESLMITGFPYDRTATLDRQLLVFERIMRDVHGVRRDGSAAIDCCHVAAGRADAFWEFGLMPWDLAAGVLALRESGALVTGFDAEEWTHSVKDVCAANPTLHAELLAVIQESLAL